MTDTQAVLEAASEAAPRPEGAAAPPLFIVFNVRSGRGDADATRRLIADACNAAGRRHEFFMVDHAHAPDDQARKAVARAREAGGIVVAAGGDGTINAVAQVVLGSGCDFGVLPQGTFNYFGRTHGIPTETEKSLEVLLTCKPQPVQVGLVNDRAFLVNASLGLYARLLEEREHFKSRYGRSRAVALLAAVATLLLRGDRRLDLRISWRGQERDVRTPTLFVGNNSLQLEQIGMEEAEALDQGELAAIALKPVGRLAMLWLMVRGGFGRLGAADDVLSLSFKSIVVKPVSARRSRIKVAADGEIQWMQMPLHFRVAPERLMLVKPPPSRVHEARK
ncbi:Diacylglycerol kinase [Burkholderiales bacterium 8X]|nr:Diacylglycerol kinase [Burkholderiales bacterium 8X]